jgi:hypothetical protein
MLTKLISLVSLFALYLTSSMISALAIDKSPTGRSLGLRDTLPPNITTPTSDHTFNMTPTDFATLQWALDTILSIPDSILLAGDNATSQYIQTHSPYTSSPLYTSFPSAAVSPSDLADLGFWDTLKCAAAIVAFIGTNIVSAAKLLRIKKYIAALGGVRKAAELLLKASNWEERLKIGGGALVGLAAEFFGFTLITNNC